MGLLDQYQIGGPSLFNAVDTPFGGQGAQPEKRGGFLGSGYDGEDIMSMLLRAAAIAQGDLGAGAHFGQNIGARARAAAERAAEEAAWRERKTWEWDNEPREGPKPPPMIRNLDEWEKLPPERKRALAEMQATLYPQFATGADKLPYQTNAAPPDFTDDDWNDGQPMGGGASNGTGGFRR